ncbi:MAG: single-stranded-DNA-specific exonuclease RecJ [Pirellulales bacterium]|nr:single-stranded-DNA-specific exonuclease RecJ [Pirellulales bacterium]
MPKRWRIASYDPARVATLGQAAGVPAVVAQLLLCRGMEDLDRVRHFLDAKLSGLRDPDELPGAPQAADLLYAAIRAGRQVTVYGDYDADGMTASAILLRCLKLLGAKAESYIPNRIDEGYGLNHDALRSIAARGGDVVVTVDCGIASVDEAETARELGLTLIITDHHQPQMQCAVEGSSDSPVARLPRAAAIVHPGLPGGGYPFAGLCGAAVAMKLAWALCQRASESKRVGEAMRTFLMRAVGLASIGTVADVVPLVDENRILVRHGLNCLRHYPTPGLLALEKITGLAEKPSLDCDAIGFTIGPRLNAAGRLGQAPLAVELLTTEDPVRANQLAEFIHGLNEQRQTLERSVYRAAHKAAEELGDPRSLPALVLAGRGWHPGVIGIVAGRLAEQYHRPTIVVALDELGAKPGAGSGRSIPGFNLHAALAACGEHLLGHGGHEAAAGLSIQEAAIEAFRIDFCAYAERAIDHADLVADLFIDAETPLSALTHQTVMQIESLAPFGAGNERPLLCTTGVRLAEPPKRIGGAGRHLALRLEQNGVALRGVAFGGGDWEDDLNATKGPLAIAFKPVINHFRGRQTVEVQLTDWRPAEAE